MRSVKMYSPFYCVCYPTQFFLQSVPSAINRAPSTIDVKKTAGCRLFTTHICNTAGSLLVRYHFHRAHACQLDCFVSLLASKRQHNCCNSCVRRRRPLHLMPADSQRERAPVDLRTTHSAVSIAAPDHTCGRQNGPILVLIKLLSFALKLCHLQPW
jgi:hypothetical protein